MKKTKLYVSLALFVQSISCLITFLALCKKHKSLAKAFGIVSAIGAVGGGVMMYLHARDRLKYKKMLLDGDCLDFSEDFDELVDLDEFSEYDDVDDICAEDGVDEIPF